MQKLIIRVQGNVPWKCFLSKEGVWIAICDPLKLTLQAETFGDLMEDIAMSLNAIFKDLLISNELDKFLQEHGWGLAGQMPNSMDDVRFDMPFIPAVVAAANGLTRELYQ
jgi:hypothetical protein